MSIIPEIIYAHVFRTGRGGHFEKHIDDQKDQNRRGGVL